MTAALLTALQQATEGSDALDREIARTCNIVWSPDEEGNFGGYDILPRRCWFTRSIDAALTLVPPAHDWIIGHTNGGLTVHAQVGPHKEAFAETPAIAIVIACLRAREAAQ